jgi:hypothetical protein
MIGCIFLVVFSSLQFSNAPAACGTSSTYFPASKYTWLEVLMTIAKNKPSKSSPYGSILAALSDAGSNAVGGGKLVASSIPSNLWDSSTTAFAAGVSSVCGTCLLGFMNQVISLINITYLSTSCTLSSHYTDRACISSMSSALVAFNACNDPSGSTDLVASLDYQRCNHSDLVNLDTQLGLYKNLVNKALYDSYYHVPGFENSKANLKCNPCFDVFVNRVRNTYGIANMISGTACGPTFGTEKIFQSSCYSTAFG